MTRSLFDLARKMTPEKVSREFRDFSGAHAYASARRLMDETFADFPDVDHSFVREFQTAGFSARVFELALFAALREQGKELDRTSPAPDFLTIGDTPVAIEATTTNPPQGGEKDDDEDIAAAVRRLIPDDMEEDQGVHHADRQSPAPQARTPRCAGSRLLGEAARQRHPLRDRRAVLP